MQKGTTMKRKNIFLIATAIVLCLSLTGCAALGAFISQLKGELFGND